MTTVHQIDLPDSAVKRELDRLELVERVPALQRQAVAYELTANPEFPEFTSYRLNERGGFIMKLPGHPAVAAYAAELKAFKWPDAADLKQARKFLRDARLNYDKRVAFRGADDIEWRDGGTFVSLSAILEARAAAMHWHRQVTKLEREQKEQRIKRRNAQLIESARPEFVTIGGELYPVSK